MYMGASITQAYYKEYKNLLRLSTAMLNDAHAAYDIVQNIAIKILEGSYDHVAPELYIPYLRKSVRNASLDYLKKNKRVFVTSPEEMVDKLHDMTDFSRVEIKLWVEACFIKEAPEIREAMIMHYIDGYTYDEISKMLGIKSSTLRSRMRRVLKALPEGGRNSTLFLLLLCNILPGCRS